jgi:hypothetical protein
MRVRPERYQYVAVTMLALAAVLYGTRPKPLQMRPWKPLSVPIRIHIGSIQTPAFSTDLDANYRLLIAAERKIEFKRLECLLGIDWQPSQTCANKVNRLDISWSVLHKEQPVATGSARDFQGGFYSDLVAREIGEFHGHKGQSYRIVLTIRQNAQELDMTNPQLLIETQPWEWEGPVIGSAVKFLAATISSGLMAMSGVLLLILMPLVRRFRS